MSFSKIKHYQELGMSESEIKLFRETMELTSQKIKSWEQQVKQSVELETQESSLKAIKIAKVLFKELVKEPRKLTIASDFIYKHLNLLNELTQKYLEIVRHETKSEAALQSLKEARSVIDLANERIIKDYEKFMADDIIDLQASIEMAKKMLDKEENNG